MRFLLPFLLALSCHAQQSLLLSGVATVPLPAVVASGPTNTTAGLVNWWKFDEGTGVAAADSVGSANGTFNGSPVWTNGQINSALYFPGSGLIDLAANTAVGNGALTFSCWLIGDSSDFAQTLIYDSNGGSSTGFFVTFNNNGVVLDIVTDGSDCSRGSDLGNGIVGTNYLVCEWGGDVTDASTITIFTNCVEAVYFNTHNGSGTHVANTTSNRHIAGGSTGTFQGGAMDNPMLWNRVLTAGEITNMYQLGLAHRNQ